ncbi:MAG: FAD/NAD(P)-binding oxidoreductase [Actinomycetota bacterium]|jgi:sulfide:quinone oxidoreductase|nr:FAD/NAD(P)-binding oxidoreductase [Actinomycetota bacterium]
MTGRVRVVIVGGSFGGLTTAYELRRRLGPERAAITLVSKDERFTFVPSLTWVAMGSRTLPQISFDLTGPLARKQVSFAHETVTGIDTERKVVTTTQAEHPYDFLVIATGHRSANEAVEGLGPFDGPGHSPMSPPEAEELAGAVRTLLADPGPVVVGAAPGASCIGPAYELAFELDHLLRRHELRHLVPITFVTPEPFLGHMGMGGAGKIRQLLEGELEERDISYRTSAAVTKITADAVELEGTGAVPSVLSIVIPPLAGVDAVAKSPGLANPKGFVPADAHYRHHSADGVYAVGVAVALPPVGETPVPVNFPKTGHMTEQMAQIAASDIVARIGGREGATAELSARCVLDMGDRGAYLAVDPVRPPRNTIPTVSEGRRWLLAKRAFERTYLWHVRHGRRMPTALGW